MRTLLMVLLGMALWGEINARDLPYYIQTLDLEERVIVSTEYRPVYLSAQEVVDRQCTPRDHFVAPWITAFNAEITAYNSEVGQTNSEPRIASNGRRVYDGGIATNTLPCGTKLKIPDLFGERIFTVNDRMNRRYQPFRQTHGLVNIDIWMEEKSDAKKLGRKTGIQVIIVEYAGA